MQAIRLPAMPLPPRAIPRRNRLNLRDEERRVSTTLLTVASLSLSALTAGLVLALSGAADAGTGRAALDLLIVVTPVTVGLYAIGTPRTARFGRLLVVAGSVWSVALLSEAPYSLPYSVGRVVGWMVPPMLVYLMLAFPDGVLPSARDRWILAAGIGLVAVLYIGSAPFVEQFPPYQPWASCTTDCPANAFFVLSSEPSIIGSLVIPLRQVLGVLLITAVTVSLAARIGASSTVGRLTTAPVLLVSVATTAVLAMFLAARTVAPDTHAARSVGLVWSLTLPAISAAFAIGLVQRRLLVGNALSALSRSRCASLAPQQHGAALRMTLGDSAVGVLVRDPEREVWLLDDGTLAEPDRVPGPGHTLRVIGDDEGPIAAIVVEDDLEGGDELVEAIVSLTEAALREGRLKAQLESSLDDLDRSRKRIATAADAERRRIERDLHDGAQQRLIALRMRLSLAEDLAQEDPGAAAQAIRKLGEDVDLALDEIRSLASGIYPPLLADRGPADALRSIARRAPVRVEIEATELTRHPTEVEGAVYFSCLEALQNVVKHGDGATTARIRLWQNGVLAFEVVDDGPGFDVARTSRGSGLRNMRDRIESLGGRLTVVSVLGEGTTIRGTLPVPPSSSRFPRGAVVAPAVEHRGEQSQRQRNPVREQPVGERRENAVGG